MHDSQDLLNLRHLHSGKDWPRPVNIEKVVVVPECTPSDISPLDIVEGDNEAVPNTELPTVRPVVPNPELAEVAFRLGQYLNSTPSKSSVASQACKFLYESYPPSREILAKHGRLRGLVKSCSYLHLEGASHGGVYVLSLNSDIFSRFRQ